MRKLDLPQSVVDYLSKANEVFILRQVSNSIKPIEEDIQVGSMICHKKPVKPKVSKSDIEPLLNRSGFNSIDEWWEWGKGLLVDNHTLCLFKLRRIDV